jgi:hypothetical protein
VLCPLWGTSGQVLRADAAAAFNALSRKYAETFRAPICVTDSYRDYASQVAVRAAKPTLAAVPGTSNHGWGVAVDLCDGVQVFGSPQHEWLRQHAMAYGWFHPVLGAGRRLQARAVALGVRGLVARQQPAQRAASTSHRHSRSTHARPARPVRSARSRSSSSRDRVRDLLRERPSTVTPGLALADGVRRAARAAGDDGQPVALASRKTMPRPSTSSPPAAVRQGMAKTSPAS